MKWPPGWKRKGMKRGRGKLEYKHMMKKRGRVRNDVTLMRLMNKSDSGEAKLPGNVQNKRNGSHQCTKGNGEMKDEAGPRQQSEKNWKTWKKGVTTQEEIQ